MVLIRWSASAINEANYCDTKYWLKRVMKEKPLRLSAYAKGTLLHGMIKNFWIMNEKGEKVPRYSSAEEFAKKADGKWMQTVMASEKSPDPKRKIEWRHEDEKWVIRARLPKICIPLYERLISECPPLYQEKEFNFVAEFKLDEKRRVRRFNGFIDEIRMENEQVVIRDYKTGYKYMEDMKLKHDPQMTLYNVGLCSLCLDSEEFAKTLGIGEERKTFMGNPHFINDKFIHEFFLIEALAKDKDKKHDLEVTGRGTRTEAHFCEVLRMIIGIEQMMAKGLVVPDRGMKCGHCDMRVSCEKLLSSALNKDSKNLEGQMLFNFAAPLYAKPIEVKVKQRRFRWKKK